MIYSGILGTSFSQLGGFMLGVDNQLIQDIMDNTDFENPVTVLTYKGEEWISSALAGELPSLYIGWGVGTGDISKEDTELFEEDVLTRQQAAVSTKEYYPADGSGQTVLYIARATLTAIDDISISEAGLFDAVEDGNLLMHSGFDDITLNGATPLQAGDQIVFSFTLDPS